MKSRHKLKTLEKDITITLTINQSINIQKKPAFFKGYHVNSILYQAIIINILKSVIVIRELKNLESNVRSMADCYFLIKRLAIDWNIYNIRAINRLNTTNIR